MPRRITTMTTLLRLLLPPHRHCAIRASDPCPCRCSVHAGVLRSAKVFVSGRPSVLLANRHLRA
jgi:hypothetical protein